MVLKRLILLLLLGLMISVVNAEDNPTPCVPASGKPLRIGAVFSLAKLMSASAGASYQGVLAMVDAFNACGGVSGRPVQLVDVPANNRNSAREAVAKLSGQVPLIIGSGSPAVSEVLLDESQKGDFVYWEVTEPLEAPHQWSFTPLINNAQLGWQTADFIQSQVLALLDDKSLRLAVIHEKRPASQQIVDALSKALQTPPVLTYAYDNVLSDSYTVAEQIREQKINVVVLVAFNRDTDQFWLNMRQADANVKAYLQVGAEPDQQKICDRIGNSDGLITVSRTGVVNSTYRQHTIGSVYDQFVTAFKKYADAAPDQSADLAASGTYLLLHSILPDAVNDFTVSNLQQKILAQHNFESSGLMGEGFAVDSVSFLNGVGAAIVQQRQDNQLCSLVPSAISTCSNELQPFPTWRERVSQPKYASCTD